jgi:Arc/MetJ-type ribon-helix-helix transcriptional regulator
MQTVQIRLPKERVRQIDKEVKMGRYHSRSEAIRSAIEKNEIFSMFEKNRKDERWEEVIDFTKVKKGGVDIKDILSRL